MKSLQTLLLISMLILITGAACSQASTGQVQPTQVVEEVGTIPTAEPEPIPAPRVPEARLLTLEWPDRLRTGDSDIVRLTLQVDEEGNITPTASFEGHEVIGEPLLIPNVYDTHNVLAEARLDMAGLEVVPDDLISQPLRPGEDLSFTWSVYAPDVGRLRGNVWLYLRFLPLDGGPETQMALFAQVIEIDVVNLFGIGGAAARIMGLVGVAASGLLGADDIFKGLGWLFKRRRSRS